VSVDLLFSSAAFFARPLETTFSLAAQAGFGGIEVMVTSDPASQDPTAMKALAAGYGLSIGAIHAPCLLLTRRVWGTDPVVKIERSVQVASEAGVPIVVVHPPYRWQSEYRRLLEGSRSGLSEDPEVTVAVENMFPFHIGRRRLTLHANQDLNELDQMPHLVLDTSHAAVAGHDLVEVRKRFGKRLRHVHLSDNAGKGWDSHLPPGEGTLDLDAFLDDLAASSYSGKVSLEVDLRRYLSDEPKLVEVMTGMRERVEARLTAGAAEV
jgi:sugar phosphate isomerase/epimerase